MKAANRYWVKDDVVNEMRGPMMVGKYDDHPNYPKLQSAHRRIAMTQNVVLKVEVFEDGSIRVLGQVSTPKPGPKMAKMIEERNMMKTPVIEPMADGPDTSQLSKAPTYYYGNVVNTSDHNNLDID